MCGVGVLCWCRGQAELGAWVVLTGRCGYLHWVSGVGCQQGGVDLEIGSDGYFDHTGRMVVIINLVTVLMERTSLMEWTSSVTSMTISIATRQNASKSWRQRMPG